jgi:hypothetical protein
MNRRILICAFFAVGAATIGVRAAAQSSPYQGTSQPPADDQITTTPEAKPPAGHPMDSQAIQSAPGQTPIQSQDETQPAPVNSSTSQDRFAAPVGSAETGTDDGIVHVADPPQALPARAYSDDPDGGIVHPHARRPGEILEGTAIRVRLLQRLSTTSSEKGEPFHTMVATDVLQDGRVVIPAGAEIDGQVMTVSSGHLGGHGSMRLAPETVTMPDGARYGLHADVTATPGSRTRVGDEGNITPGSQLKRDSIEYGGAVGAGLVTGAILGGPAGAAAGSLIGAGVITVHLLVSHPQATLEQGTNMMLTLTEPLDLVPAIASRN